MAVLLGIWLGILGGLFYMEHLEKQQSVELRFKCLEAGHSIDDCERVIKGKRD